MVQDERPGRGISKADSRCERIRTECRPICIACEVRRGICRAGHVHAAAGNTPRQYASALVERGAYGVCGVIGGRRLAAESRRIYEADAAQAARGAAWIVAMRDLAKGPKARSLIAQSDLERNEIPSRPGEIQSRYERLICEPDTGAGCRSPAARCRRRRDSDVGLEGSDALAVIVDGHERAVKKTTASVGLHARRLGPEHHSSICYPLVEERR